MTRLHELTGIEALAVVSVDGEPAVNLGGVTRKGDRVTATLDPATARTLALDLIDAANVAECDAVTFTALRANVGDGPAAGFIELIRQARTARDEAARMAESDD